MKRLAFFVLAICLSSVAIFGQASSGVTGVVTDQGGAVVPGVEVVLVDTKTSREFTTTTNENGSYAFNNITPGGGYRLTFTSAGFQKYVLNDVQLGIGRTETQNAQLTAGQVSETVEVVSTTGDATLNTTDASIGNVIGQRQLKELPIQIRGTPAALIGLQPGALGTNIGAGATGGNRTGSVTGSRADQGNITVDGIDANDVTTQQAFNTVANAPIDSIQEFRAVTSGPNAAEGRSSGGQIQLTTQSGTNAYHGNVREYWRHEQFAANTFFNNRSGVRRPNLRRHQFGGSFGGPLPFFNFGDGADDDYFISGKDRLFFFFDFEGRRDRSQAAASRTVPLQHFREGRIGYVMTTGTGGACPTNARLNTRPDCIGFLTQGQIAALDPQGVGVNTALLSFINSRYPLPNDLLGGNGVNTGLFRFNAPNTRDDQIYTTRIDGTPGDNHRLFGRLTVTRRDSTNAVQQFPGDDDAVTFQDRSYSLAGGHTWIINSQWTNVATLGLSKSVNIFTPPDIPSFPNSFTAGGVLTAPFPSLSFQDRNVYVPTFRDDMTYTTGSHTFQFGASFKPIRQNPSLINDFNFVTLGLGGTLTALNASFRPANIRTGTTAAYDAAYAYLLGRIGQVATNFVYDPAGNPSAPGSGRKRSYAYNEYEYYVQDNWKIRNDLTLNLGVRYHVYPSPYEVNGFQASNDTDLDDLVATRIGNAASGTAGNSAEPFVTFDLSGKANNGRPLYETDWNNFAPRLGFAWNPSFNGGVLGALFGDRKTVVRGNASMVYDRVGGAITFIQDQSNYVFDSSATTNFGGGLGGPAAALLNNPRFTGLASLPVSNTAPSVTRPNTPFVDEDGVPFGNADGESSYLVAQNFKIPYSYTFNFGVQRELPGNFLLDVAYVGRLGRKLFTQSDAAQALNFKDPGSGQLLFDALNNIQSQIQSQRGTVPDEDIVVSSQPWFENQINLALGSNTCTGQCTGLIASPDFFQELIRQGGTADFVQQMFASGLLRPNVGLSGQFSANQFVSNQGTSVYHGMLVSLQKRFSQGFEFDLNYTWSHSIDNQSSITNTVSGGLLCDITNVNACRGDSDFDIRHVFNANYILELPFGRGRAIGGGVNRWVDTFIGGWSFSGIVGARSGLALNSATGVFPVSFFVNSPALGRGGAQSGAFASGIQDTAEGVQFFADPAAAEAALRFPRHGEVGGRNTFRSPGFWNWDMGLAKKIAMPWSENHRLTLRVDAFNVFNQNFFNGPGLTFDGEGGGFGIITTSASAPRELQFAVRYDF